MQPIDRHYSITHVNVSAKIRLSEGSLSRSVGREQSSAATGRYGILICNLKFKGKQTILEHKHTNMIREEHT